MSECKECVRQRHYLELISMNKEWRNRAKQYRWQMNELSYEHQHGILSDDENKSKKLYDKQRGYMQEDYDYFIEQIREYAMKWSPWSKRYENWYNRLMEIQGEIAKASDAEESDNPFFDESEGSKDEERKIPQSN